MWASFSACPFGPRWLLRGGVAQEGRLLLTQVATVDGAAIARPTQTRDLPIS
jgi:hypothetical protein